MIAEDYIDVVGAQSVIEVADVVAGVLGARMEMGGEPGRIVVTGASDSGLRIVIGLAVDDRSASGTWTRRIAITHHSDDERARWARQLHHALTARRGWVLTLTCGDRSDPAAAADDTSD
ncbi:MULTISPECIES: hypothetical protein [unclassified Rhodococcus (in: high G+C Gram-positive bacteria)]|uniref:hypothetical protein n=1 Tax=unclassified Rhodococcus (in: high G+C Gram-positive bacteria) TaxID=192944 RepID=UPI00163B481D|nr:MULTISPECIES: hypothetical protein [unclassified Rhodococcus (in: high G+C Gram-positive bacteria)]MBC2644543.1 hypothetical protein [Rhodococcus sp. 3A]MBC2897768.1 hypothetical protein [Rhodococcus sp. 4CII]